LKKWVAVGGEWREMKSNEMRDILIRKGTELFYREGFARSSIRDIGRAAGISSATLYHYFKNKDDLLYEIIISIGKILLEVLSRTSQEFSDPEQRLRQMVFRQICLLKEKKEEVKIYIEEQYQLPKRLKKVVYEQHRQIYEVYLNELRELQKAGRLRVDHLPIINFTIFATMNWVYRWYKEEEDLSIEQIADMIITILSDGIFLPRNRQKRAMNRGQERKS